MPPPPSSDAGVGDDRHPLLSSTEHAAIKQSCEKVSVAAAAAAASAPAARLTVTVVVPLPRFEGLPSMPMPSSVLHQKSVRVGSGVWLLAGQWHLWERPAVVDSIKACISVEQ